MLPEIVYHYCSTDTFTKIIQNKTLRLSDIENSNDFMEKSWSIHQCLKFIQEIITSDSNLEADICEQLINCVESEFTKYNRMILACCFSSERDLLSQWRGYGDNGAGVSIGVNAVQAFSPSYARTEELFNSNLDILGSMKSLGFGAVRYNDKPLLQITENLLTLYAELIPDGMKPEEAARILVRLLYPALPYFKNPAFLEEAEYRFVYYPDLPVAPYVRGSFSEEEFQTKIQNQKKTITIDNFVLQPMSYRERNKNLVSYRDFSFAGVNEPFIKNVTLGPRSPLDRETIKLYFELNGLHIDIENIFRSTVSYR